MLNRNHAAYLLEIEALHKNKPHCKVITKAVEELNELSAKLMQEHNRPGKCTEYDILEEIADVEINLDLLKKSFRQDNYREVLAKKIDLFLNSKTVQKYGTKAIIKKED